MGDRGQVFIKNTGVYLYTHWHATKLIEDVRRALSMRARWDDPEYLARIIFETMLERSNNPETGYGIDTAKKWDIWRLVIVDCETQTVMVMEGPNIKEMVLCQSFEDFVASKGGDA